MSDPVTAVGIDVGSSNTKTVLLAVWPDRSPTELARHTAVTPYDARKLVSVVRAGVRAVLADAVKAPDAVGIASMAETGVPVGFDGEPLTQLIKWNRGKDPSATDGITFIDSVDLAAATGIPVSPKAPLAVWHALRRDRPELMSAMAKWAGVADLVCHDLVGELVTDHTLAGRTMALHLPPIGLPVSDVFDAELLATVGLHPAQLPRVARPGASAGPVQVARANDTGLVAGTPVFIAGHDHAVGAWAAGVRSPGACADSIGTAEALLRISDAPIDRIAACASGMTVSRTVTGEHEVLMAGTAGGGFISWFCLHVLDGVDPVSLFADVDTVADDEQPLFVLPYISGRQSPAPDPKSRMRVEDAGGREVDTSALVRTRRGRARLGRAVLAGLSLQLRWMDAEQRRIASVDRGGFAEHPLVVVAGESARNPAWLTIKREVLGREVRSVDVAEPVAAGAAMLALVRAGAVDPGVALPSIQTIAASAPGDQYADAFARFVLSATSSTRQHSNYQQ